MGYNVTVLAYYRPTVRISDVMRFTFFSHRILKRHPPFLPRDASAERGYEIACRPSARPSVRLSVCDDQVPCSNRFEFFENNFTAE